jgi:signal transduction histidine kinase
MPIDASTARDLKEQAGTLLDEVIKDARNISHMLNSDYITRNGLVASVQKELEDISRTVKIDCSFEVQGDYYSLDDERELLVFRMVQEAINNAVKHAQATRLSVIMDYHENDFTITITDNGKGFDIRHLADGSGIGLMNMRNRAGMIKGTLAVDSGDKGTSIKLSIKI